MQAVKLSGSMILSVLKGRSRPFRNGNFADRTSSSSQRFGIEPNGAPSTLLDLLSVIFSSHSSLTGALIGCTRMSNITLAMLTLSATFSRHMERSRT